MKYNKLLGQHFIYDEILLKRIVNTAGCIANYNILEIGGGIGTLTKSILEEKPISLTTIEKDHRFECDHKDLQGKYSNYNYIAGDVLNCDFREIVKKPVVVISNLPYNISSVLLLKLLECADHFEFFVLMFQKEVAQRITANPRTKNYGILSVLTQILCEVRYEFEVKPDSFVPPPKVQSAVVKIIPYKKPKYNFNRKALNEILSVGFSQRRKMIKTSLRKIFKNSQEMDIAFQELDKNSRIEELSVQQLADLSLTIKD